MATAKKPADPADAPPVTDSTAGADTPPAPAVDQTPATPPADPDPVDPAFVEAGKDPRGAALAALLHQELPNTVATGGGAVKPVEVIETGNDRDWWPDGDQYLVVSAVYPRAVPKGKDRFDQPIYRRVQARRGDLVRLPDDKRTRTDVAAGYLRTVSDQS